MNRRRLRFAAVTTTTIFSLLISLLTSTFPVTSAVNSTSDNLNLRRTSPLILPLSLSRKIPSAKLRRLLQAKRVPINARMNLFDDLLSNGYYTTRLYIGTPPQEFALIVDTGSTVTYVPCSDCDQCGNHQDPKFQPDLSTTYHPVKCNPDCTCDAENAQCVYERQYAEMSSSSGVLGEDIVSFGNQSELKPQRAVFGCENAETGDLYSQHADGIMGLGRGDLSIVDQLVDKSVIGDSFSLCYGGMGIGGGAMILGSLSPPSDMVFSHSDPDRSPYYNIELKELHVAGKKLAIDPKVFDGKHGTVLDSGTTYAYLPEAAFVAFKRALISELHGLKQIRGPDPNYNDICFSGAGRKVSELSKTFPAVDMVFENGLKYLLSPENYLFKHSKVPGAYCLGVFQNGKDPTTLLGGIVVRNTLVTYDREHLKVGFWKTNCSELWEGLRVTDNSPTPAPAPAPAPLNGEVSTPGLLPTPASASAPGPAPKGVPSYAIPGEIKVGFITFDMSLSIKDSDLKPRISELSGFIAQELGVNTLQVHLLNFTSSGNGSLITWGIYPEKSAKYIANTTAMHIIAHLAEHNVQLPDTFGSYTLANWKVEPPMKRSWWHQHYLLVVMAVIVSLMLGISVYGIWFIRKWRQQTTIQYKPVDSDTVVPEQELQPL
ncbi:aspartic proteinase nepenthesin-1-like [Chenopodium quinoa]|uniref:aspartic proteinase nepenthesin-1-like n=1 Tax=Chenopodium quinoa TaxID=63459 RepID=UPI000B77EBFB|nr:aspartic proteinase nepenthesin-1-like [Chenopodium quinoa]